MRTVTSRPLRGHRVTRETQDEQCAYAYIEALVAPEPKSAFHRELIAGMHTEQEPLYLPRYLRETVIAAARAANARSRAS